ncbi:hypothetical protein COEREDRAFT_8521 [Coemansia reversa NRRL 1564]|uniref:NAD(P)-binding protein n=1 Tax=Coemansia reversa (strain ATCC 12441 / NRRL 1564) TaxID=763665 RepID=A0A2G5BBN0_COERN|nr:hypothetical protein COEREDRAFT_8521 [Coemansia reversa NRRL 1564]|eukprot:PIA16402.1 hypothetical protein COEREDRAFT_8521 [Coemansia reversa NRRL 1564]
MADTKQSQKQPVVLIIRVGSWIGAEAAVHFLKRGVTVIGIGVDPTRLNSLCAALARLTPSDGTPIGKFISCAGLPTDKALQDKVVEHIKREGYLTAMINNAGAYEGPSEGASPIELWESLQRSLFESLPLLHRIRHDLRKWRCRVLNVAADDAQTGLPHHVALVAIKTAVNMLTAELALLEPRVTTLAIHPGLSLPLSLSTSSAAAATTSSTEAGVAKLQDNLLPAGELIADLALNADHSMSGQFYMYSEPEFLKISH